MKPIEEATILQFASGELDAERESTFLAQCELSPEAWRESVLAVAEHRRMVEVLGELAAEEMPSPAATRPQRAAVWRTLPLVAAAAAAGLLIGILATHVAGPGASRQPQIVQTQQPTNGQPAQPPAPETMPAAAHPTTVAAEAATEKLPAGYSQPPAANDEFQRDVLAKHGFQVEDEPTLYVVTQANGTRWAVPAQRTTLHYVKR
jgi:hypothetical protein